jgi:hypothetical protein
MDELTFFSMLHMSLVPWSAKNKCMWANKKNKWIKCMTMQCAMYAAYPLMILIIVYFPQCHLVSSKLVHPVGFAEEMEVNQ